MNNVLFDVKRVVIFSVRSISTFCDIAGALGLAQIKLEHQPKSVFNEGKTNLRQMFTLRRHRFTLHRPHLHLGVIPNILCKSFMHP